MTSALGDFLLVWLIYVSHVFVLFSFNEVTNQFNYNFFILLDFCVYETVPIYLA